DFRFLRSFRSNADFQPDLPSAAHKTDFLPFCIIIIEDRHLAYAGVFFVFPKVWKNDIVEE
ncbi:MAG: hypothetical protein J6W63_10530, partial [Treponema sp.]|nr:hypothetical protein [Treponema sp.]